MDLRVFVEDYPDIVNHQILNDKVFLIALQSLNNLLIHTSASDGDIESVPGKNISKILMMIKVISMSAYPYVLSEWANNLIDEISIDLSQISYLGALLNVAHCVGYFAEWKNDSEAKERMIKSILQCRLIINGGPDLKSKSRIFYWLAQWLKHTELESDVTAENLLAQAWDTIKNETD